MPENTRDRCITPGFSPSTHHRRKLMDGKDAEERPRGLFVACGDGAPLFQPCPEVLDEMAIVVDPLRAGDGRVATFGWDGGTRAQVPDTLAKGIGGEAPIADNPSGHVRQTAEQPRGKRQFMRLSGGEREGNGAPAPVCDHTGFCAIAAARAAKRLAHISLLAVDPLFCAPAALW